MLKVKVPAQMVQNLQPQRTDTQQGLKIFPITSPPIRMNWLIG